MNTYPFADEPPVQAFFHRGVSQLGKPFQGNPDFPPIGEGNGQYVIIKRNPDDEHRQTRKQNIHDAS